MKNTILPGIVIALCFVFLFGSPGLADDASPVTILFAGDSLAAIGDGGPCSRPPEERVDPSNDCYRDGYYTDDSRQKNPGMDIEVSAADRPSFLQPIRAVRVTLIWMGAQSPGGELEILGEYDFTRDESDGLWKIKTDSPDTGIETQEGIYYTFDVEAEYSDGEILTVEWNKTAPHSTSENWIPQRRHVQLSCTAVADDYFNRPYYLRIGDYGLITDDDRDTDDRYHHDSGPDGGGWDTGVLSPDLPTLNVESRFCQRSVGYWFDDSISVPDENQPFAITNIYFHVWVSQRVDVDPNPWLALGWGHTRTFLDFSTNINNQVWYPVEDKITSIEYDLAVPPGFGYEPSTDYKLIAGRMDTDFTTFSDNNIYEMFIYAQGGFTTIPSIISSRRIVSFVIFNLPDKQTLRGRDSDGDGITDHDELYVTFTSPFLTDTDHDGWPDDFEVPFGSDPNSYLDTPWGPPGKPPLPVEQD